MRIARYKNPLAGVVLGALAAAITARFDWLMHIAGNPIQSALYLAAEALALPGWVYAILIGRSSHSIHLWLAAIVNFVFWFGFAWLFATLVDKLRTQFRILLSYR